MIAITDIDVNYEEHDRLLFDLKGKEVRDVKINRNYDGKLKDVKLTFSNGSKLTIKG